MAPVSPLLSQVNGLKVHNIIMFYYFLQDEATAALDPDLLPDHPHGLWGLMGCQTSDQEVNITAQKPQIICDHITRSPQDPPPAEGDEAAKPPVWCNFALPWR